LFRKELQTTKVVVPSITLQQLQSQFVDVVSEDVVRNGQIYGLPLALDTLVLYYNKDLLRGANILEPPKTWTQLATVYAPRLTIADEEGKIVQSGIALGTGKNTSHAADIVSLLLLQDGVAMNPGDGSVRLNDSVNAEGTNLGVNALSYYTSFADKDKSSYSWNAEQPESLEAFIRGKTTMYIGYGYDRQQIEAKSSVNFGIAPIPHLSMDGKDGYLTSTGTPLQANFGNYSVLSVFQRSPHVNEAWNFIQYITKQDAIARAYIAATGRVAALRSILSEQTNDPDRGVLAQQAISVRSWYHGRNATATEQYIIDMIDSIVSKKATIEEAMGLARKRIELTLK
jgi:ABC-type glycerol-3-phosphate transport system substrate-binding protein